MPTERKHLSANPKNRPNQALGPSSGQALRQASEQDYRRDLGLKEATAIVVGRVIGSGIFRTPGPIMALVASTSLFALVWIVGAVVTVLSATCYGELAAMMPRAGGPYVYLREAYPPVFAFLRGWAMFFVSETGAIAAVALVFAEHLGAALAPIAGAPFSTLTTALVALGTIWLLTTINLFGVRFSGLVQDALAVLKILAVLTIIVASFGAGGTAANFVSPWWPDEFSWETVLVTGAALRYSFFAFSGWEGATYVAEEVEKPERNLPGSLLLGIFMVLVLYLGANAAYLFQLSPAEIAASKWVAVDALEAALGVAGGVVIAIAVALNTFGNISTQILSKARAWQAMARDRLFFDWLRPLHPRYGTPNASLIAQGVWASVLLGFAILSERSYELLIDFFSATSGVFAVMTLLAVWVLRRRQPKMTRPYRAWGYPYGLWVAVSVYGAYLLVTLLTAPLPSLAGLALTATGLVYYRWRRNRCDA